MAFLSRPSPFCFLPHSLQVCGDYVAKKNASSSVAFGAARTDTSPRAPPAQSMVQLLWVIGATASDPHHTAYVTNSAPEEEPLSESGPRALAETECNPQTSTCTRTGTSCLTAGAPICPGDFCSKFQCDFAGCDFNCVPESSAGGGASGGASGGTGGGADSGTAPPAGTSGGRCIAQCGALLASSCDGLDEFACVGECTWLEANAAPPSCPPPPPLSPPFGTAMGEWEAWARSYISKGCPVRATAEPTTPPPPTPPPPPRAHGP